LVAKQIGVNVVEYALFKYFTGRKVEAVYTKYKAAIETEADV